MTNCPNLLHLFRERVRVRALVYSQLLNIVNPSSDIPKINVIYYIAPLQGWDYFDALTQGSSRMCGILHDAPSGLGFIKSD